MQESSREGARVWTLALLGALALVVAAPQVSWAQQPVGEPGVAPGAAVDAEVEAEREVEVEAEPGGAVETEAETAVDAEVEVEPATDHPGARNNFVLAPHVGVLVPQLFSELGAWPLFGLEVGYILPFDVGSMRRPLQLSVDALYTQPGADGSGASTSLGEAGGNYQWELVQRTLILEASALWRFIPPGESFSAYGSLGPRLYLMETELQASGNGADFGENRETNTEYGFFVGGGVEFALGPGSLFTALEFGWSDLNQTITGDANTGALALDIGYRLFLF